MCFIAGMLAKKTSGLSVVHKGFSVLKFRQILTTACCSVSYCNFAINFRVFRLQYVCFVQ